MHDVLERINRMGKPSCEQIRGELFSAASRRTGFKVDKVQRALRALRAKNGEAIELFDHLADARLREARMVAGKAQSEDARNSVDERGAIWQGLAALAARNPQAYANAYVRQSMREFLKQKEKRKRSSQGNK